MEASKTVAECVAKLGKELRSQILLKCFNHITILPV